MEELRAERLKFLNFAIEMLDAWNCERDDRFTLQGIEAQVDAALETMLRLRNFYLSDTRSERKASEDRIEEIKNTLKDYIDMGVFNGNELLEPIVNEVFDKIANIKKTLVR